MALAGNPDILIADEPTTALDVTIQRQILDLIKRIQRERKLSVLLITHDLGVVKEVADRVCVLYAGQVVESGSVHDVLSNPRHPYTSGLLASLPHSQIQNRIEGMKKPLLQTIPGTVPSLFERPQGCQFQARCVFRKPVCEVGTPILHQLESREVRCVLMGNSS